MYIIETHSQALKASAGTRMATVGNAFLVATVDDADRWLRGDLIGLGKSWHRAYVRRGNDVVAVLARQNDQLHYLACAPHYQTKWQLPFVGSPAAQIATFVLVSEFVRGGSPNDPAPRAWAEEMLKTAITAVIVDPDGICAAWEKPDGNVRLVARGSLHNR